MFKKMTLIALCLLALPSLARAEPESFEFQRARLVFSNYWTRMTRFYYHDQRTYDADLVIDELDTVNITRRKTTIPVSVRMLDRGLNERASLQTYNAADLADVTHAVMKVWGLGGRPASAIFGRYQGAGFGAGFWLNAGAYVLKKEGERIWISDFENPMDALGAQAGWRNLIIAPRGERLDEVNSVVTIGRKEFQRSLLRGELDRMILK